MGKLLNLLITVLLLFSLCIFAGCSTAKDRHLTITGSTALAPLVKYAAEDFMEKHPDVVVRVTGGGSYGGFYQVLSGAADIGISIIPIPEELKETDLQEYAFASAPLVFIAHLNIETDSLTHVQIERILCGEITNWNELGGKDQPIILVHRQSSSGIRSLIKEKILPDKEFDLRAVTQDSCGSLRQVVATTPGAIGYATMFFADDSVKMLSYNSIPCDPGCIKCETYPLVARGILLTNGEPSGLTGQFIDYITSEWFLDAKYEQMGFYRPDPKKAR